MRAPGTTEAHPDTVQNWPRSIWTLVLPRWAVCGDCAFLHPLLFSGGNVARASCERQTDAYPSKALSVTHGESINSHTAVLTLMADRAWLEGYSSNLVKGVILQYARGLRSGASLEWTVGMLHYARQKLHVPRDRIIDILREVETDAHYLPAVREMAVPRMQKLRDRLNE